MEVQSDGFVSDGYLIWEVRQNWGWDNILFYVRVEVENVGLQKEIGEWSKREERRDCILCCF